VITHHDPAPIPVGGEVGDGVALALRGVGKSFGDTAAVVDVDLAVTGGAFFGLVGPNGAGKTTLLSMTVGLLCPDAGNSPVLVVDVWDVRGADRAKALLGVAPQGLALPPRLTGRELLTHLGALRSMPARTVADRSDGLLTVLDLDHGEGTPIGDYSTGMRKKIGLAAALLHGPRLLVLDAPLEAIDPVSAAVIRAILPGFCATGGTVVMSSHVMAVVEQLCDHVAVLDHGRILRAGTLEQVRGTRSLTEAFGTIVGAQPLPPALTTITRPVGRVTSRATA
jgi:ABC-2 type transport system ATP-binding protein